MEGTHSRGRARSPLRRRLAAGERLLGTFSLIPSPDVVELVALAGFDAVILDMEHGPYVLESLRACLLAAHARGLSAIVRVAGAEPPLIGAALDVGADGVLVPQVSSARAAAEVVAAARFAPEGRRGANPWVRGAAYSGSPGWYAQANRDVAVLAMIEGAQGLSAVAGIVDVAGLDALFLGPVDMSHSLGVPGEVDHPRVVDALEDVRRRAAARGIATAAFAPDARRARFWYRRGVTMVACGVDTDLIRRAFATAVDEARQPSP